MSLDSFKIQTSGVQIFSPLQTDIDNAKNKLTQLLSEEKNVVNRKNIAINIAQNINDFNKLLNTRYENTKDLLETFHKFFLDVTEGHELLYFISQHGSVGSNLRIEFAGESTYFGPSIWGLRLHKSLEGSTRISPRFSFECIEEIDVNDKGRLLDMIQQITLKFLQEQLGNQTAQEK